MGVLDHGPPKEDSPPDAYPLTAQSIACGLQKVAPFQLCRLVNIYEKKRNTGKSDKAPFPVTKRDKSAP
jgi:hypothetical protein